MEEGPGSVSSNDDTENFTLFSCFLASVQFIVLVYFLCHTADNYFSPVLAAVCDLLDTPQEVAGVTFLAFGNGAPDVFSSMAAIMSTSSSPEVSLLVGIGALLGAGVFIVTVGVAIIVRANTPTVPAVAFTRDIVFLLLALLLVLRCNAVGYITVWSASYFLVLYVLYVAFVVGGSKLRATATEPASDWGVGIGRNEQSNGGIRSGDRLSAFWHNSKPSLDNVNGFDTGLLRKKGRQKGEDEKRGIVELGKEPLGGGSKRTPIGSLDSPRDLNSVKRPEVVPDCAVIRMGEEMKLEVEERPIGGKRNEGIGGGGRGEGLGERANDGDGHREANGENMFPLPLFAGQGNPVIAEHFGSGLGERGGDVHQGLVWSSDEEDDGGGLGVVSKMPGSVMSLFLQGDYASSGLAMGRARGVPGEVGRGGSTITQPLLGGQRSVGGRGRDHNGRQEAMERGQGNSLRRMWTGLQWKQWRLRRRLRRQLVGNDFWILPWWRKLFIMSEFPLNLARNATIPPVDAESWSQTQAWVSMCFAPIFLALTVTGSLESDFFGTDLPTWVVVATASIVLGPAVYLTTHKGHPPHNKGYSLLLTTVAFLSCMAWMYLLADRAVDMIQEVGSFTGIPSSVLGLTVLAWGNSAGDIATNLSVARAGYSGMAVAGSYGGPLFNILVGIGLPLLILTIQVFPQPIVFTLDLVSRLTVWATGLALICTLVALAMTNFSFPAGMSFLLGGGYIAYLFLSLLITVFGE